ncbi:hypothetical protein H4J58_18765 [Colwellia sp. MB3u-70]|uniref:beta strand repeat-containing protein n=1 Tax=unclassified Colwellia TaxID=196834 RepID=UPI0015F5F450|nr:MULTISPECIES: hypothetical protein [unclassified Colwellia]MBA6292163.1 hypothetical protein [Colwellia sp. MB3u-8]MBA6309145.1 hypothetical protein [Colwellia sp. MB3u-70]
MALFQRLSFVLLFATLIGCGGSAGGFDESPDDGSTPDAITISLAISDKNLAQATPQTLTVNVMQGSTPLSDKLVTFTVSNTDLASFSTDVNTSSTDADGNAEIGLLVGSSSGDGSITASVDGIDSNSVTFKSAGDGSEEVSNFLTITNFTNSGAISKANPSSISVHFESSDGINLANEVIAFTSTLGVLDPNTGTVLSNSTGDATIILAAGTVRGAGTLTATSTSGDVATQGFFTEGDGAEQGGNSLAITSFTNITSISNATPASIAIHFETADGTDLSNEVITFTSTLGALDPKTGTVLTDSSGNASITLSAGTVRGAGVLTASSSAGDAVTQGFFTEGDSPEEGGNSLTITSFTNSTSISNATPASITIHFEAANGNDLSDEVIVFTSTLGVLDPVVGTVLTNSSGDATITLFAGTVRGAGVLTASSSAGDVVTQGFFSEGNSVGSGVNISLALTDSDGNEVEQISSISSGKLIATVTGVNKAVIVTFTTDLGTIPIQTAIATTGSDYIATVDLLAGNSLGAGTVIAQLVSGESEQLVFSIGASSLGMGHAIDGVTGLPDGLIAVPAGVISAGATAGLSVSIWDVSNASASTPATLFTTETVEVSFTSGCSVLSVPTANIDSPVATIAGIAQSTYLAQGCQGPDIVTATANAGGTVLSATGTVTISSPDSGSIEFISATPENISLKGVGGIESSTVVFKVRDTNGNVVANKDVDFSLNTEVGGIGWSPKFAQTDSNGLVQTVVNSGTVHTSVRVRAELNEDASIFTQSKLLVISTGIPDQDSFSLSASVFNPEAWNIDGTEVIITARLADAFNNPAPDGTAVAFTTEGGAIENSCVTTKGACSVIWTSQNVRPEGQELGEVNDGPTLVQGTVDISKGLDFTEKPIKFTVTTPENAADTVSLNSNFASKAELLDETNEQLVDSGVKAVSGFEGLFELISTTGLDITITDTSVGSVTTFDVLGLKNGITYYNNVTQIIGLSRINRIKDGKDFSTNDIKFTVTTDDGSGSIIATVFLDENYTSSSSIISRINTLLNEGNRADPSPVQASESIENGISYVKLTTTSGLDITIADQGGSSSTSNELGIPDGIASTFVGTNAIKIINAGRDFSINDIEFNVQTTDGLDTVTLNSNYDSPADIVEKVNTDLAVSSVVASEFIYAGDTYLLLKSPTRLNIKITNGAGTSDTFAELGIADGTTFASRINSASPSSNNFMGQKYGGRATISATAIGEESFPDFNGNGLYDQIEKNAFLGINDNSGLDVNGSPYDLTESFIDYNEDGIYNPDPTVADGERVGGETGGEEEKFDDFNSSAEFDLENNKYNGSLCGDADNCAVKKSINVRGTLVLVMSGSNPMFVTNYPTNGDSIDIVQDGTAAAAVTIADFHNQPMPAGTTVIFEAAVGSVKGLSTYTWPNTSFNGGSSFAVTIEGVKDKDISGPLVVTVTTPLGVTTSYTVATINITSL